MLVIGANSGAALALAKLAAEKKKPLIAVTAATARLTNEECTAYTVHYAYDTISVGVAPAAPSSKPAARIGTF